jgi:predicted methyltransferase
MKYLIALILTAVILPVHAALDWQAALEGEQRSAENKARDEWRHPRQTLEFFGLEKGMNVLEVSPGGGWYTEILAPLVREPGTLYAAHYALNPDHGYYRRSLGGFLQKIGGNDDLYGRVVVTQFQPPFAPDAAPAGSIDLALTFRNMHGWVRADNAGEMLAAIYRALKPGGVLGVVQHRAPAGTSLETMKKSGYLTEQAVIDLAAAAGFELVEKSDINANPRDTADHPEGVWTLPPVLRLGDVDRDKYLAIGESDRMTLKFVKPAR